MKINQSLQMMALTALGLMAVACGKIPDAYQGNFKDVTNNVSVTLGSNDGSVTLADGRKIEAKADDGSFDNLSKAAAGIYIRDNSENKNLKEVIWLNPNAATKQTDSNMVWFDSEVFFAIIDTTVKDKVQALEFSHFLKGEVEFDSGSKDLEVGCPVGAESIKATRIN